jgi:Methylamine utilisation protein MauE
MIDPALGLLIVVALALLFAVAAIHKLRNLERFARVLAAYRVVPEAAARRLAWTIPCLELAVAFALPSPPARRWAAGGAAALLILYAASMGLNLARNRRDLDCGCAAAGRRRPIAAWMVWRNLILAAAALAAALPSAARPLAGADLVTVIGGVAASVAFYMALDRLLGEIVPRAALLTRSVP